MSFTSIPVAGYRPRKGDTVTWRDRKGVLGLWADEKLGTVMDTPEHDPETFSVEDSDGNRRWLTRGQLLEVYRNEQGEAV